MILPGLANAALIAWKLTVINAITNAAAAATANIHQLIVMRYGKSCNHLFIAHQATGNAITDAIRIRITNLFESKPMILNMVAPNTFLNPDFFCSLLCTKCSQSKQTHAANKNCHHGKDPKQACKFFFALIHSTIALVHKFIIQRIARRKLIPYIMLYKQWCFSYPSFLSFTATLNET